MIAIVGRLDPVSLRTLTQIHPRGAVAPAFAIVLDTASWADPDAADPTWANAAATLRASGWTVVAGPPRRPDRRRSGPAWSASAPIAVRSWSAVDLSSTADRTLAGRTGRSRWSTGTAGPPTRAVGERRPGGPADVAGARRQRARRPAAAAAAHRRQLADPGLDLDGDRDRAGRAAAAAAARHRSLHLLPGLVLLVGYLTRVYLPDHAWLGVIPTRATWSDLDAVSTRARPHRARQRRAAGLDRARPALPVARAGRCSRSSSTCSSSSCTARPWPGCRCCSSSPWPGAVPRDPVSWIWFALAGAGYLLILSSRSVDDLRSWGRVVARPERGITVAADARRCRVAGSGCAAIVVAVLVPFVLPLGSVNVLVERAAQRPGRRRRQRQGQHRRRHRPAGDAARPAHPQLRRSTCSPSTSSGAGAKSAFYLRSAVLENYNGKAWVQGPSAPTVAAPPAASPSRRRTFGSSVATTRSSTPRSP